jgi:hypothetical protein
VIDLVQAQKDLTAILLSSEQLRSVNVFSYREKRIQQETDYRKFLVTPRNGRAGAMVQVLMPRGLGKNPNVTGPVIDWEFGIVCHEMPAINMVPDTGTLLSAEELAQIVMDVLHQEADDKLGVFSVTSKAMDDEKEYVFPGCVAYRVSLIIVGKSLQTTRCAPVQITVDSTAVTTTSCAAGTCALTCGTAGARIKYTLDGSFPAEDDANNPASTLYSGTFTLSSGDILRTAAYKTGFNKSATRYALVT